MKKFKTLIIILFVLLTVSGRANNILISNVSSVPGTGFVQLQFDLSWDNSWKNSVNWDAAWVFFKFKDNDGTWHHLNLTNSNNLSTNAGYTINVPPDMTGAMIYRNATGSGSVALTGMRVGVNNLPGSFDIKAFAIEMVDIPQGDQYYLGDGINGVFYSNNSGTPFLVNSTSITIGTGAGLLYDGIWNGATVALGPTFPIGYNNLGAFQSNYMMKHEISQGAYRDFLNTLTYIQQASRTGIAPNSSVGLSAMGVGTLSTRNSIQIATQGVSNSTPAIYGCNLNNNGVFDEASDGEWIAANWLSWPDFAAFLDWAALRPMTEMEFEKACRGPLTPVAGENAAGTTAAAAYSYTLTNAGTANESANYTGSVLNANITYSSTAPGGGSPTRVGMHATQYATRISAGAGYYGCLDLSGNIWEYTVTTANVAGRSFTGVNGNGILNPAGDADEDFWPGINGNTTGTTANTAYGGASGVNGAAGSIIRGGSCATTGANNNKVSYRTGGGLGTINTRSNGNGSGGRGVKNW